MKKLFLSIIVLISLIPSYSKAADNYTLLEPLPCISGVSNCKEGDIQKEIDINGYILYVYKFSIGLAVVLAIVMIIWGGFEYMTSEVPFIKSDGKTKIQNAVTGLAMVLVSYLILVTIDPRLVNIYSNIEPIKIKNDQNYIQDFQTELASNLEVVSLSNQLKISEIEGDIKGLQSSLADIESRYNRKEVSKSEYEVEVSKIKQDISTLKVKKSVVIAEDAGLSAFSKVIMISHSDNTSELNQYTAEPIKEMTGTLDPLPTNSKNVIQNQYNEQINAIKSESNSSADKRIMLDKQKYFFIAQAQEEAELARFLISKRENSGLSAGDPRLGTGVTMGAYQPTNVKNIANIDSNYLNKKLVEYQGYQKTPETGAKEAGLSVDIYKGIIDARINSINQALGKK